MDKIKTVKIKNEDGTVSEESYFISVDATNVDMSNGRDLQDTIGNIDIDEDGSVSSQLNNLNNNITNLNDNIKKKVYYFDTVADMKNAKLKKGDFVITLGYYEANDGGGAEYKIDNNRDVSQYQEKINNELYATLLILNNSINANQFGAKGDGITNDTVAIQTAIDYCSSNNLILYFICNNTYLVNTLNITNDINIDGNYCTLKSNGENVINIENTYLSSKYLKNIKIVDVPTNKIGIYCNPARRYVLDGISMSNISGTGIKVATYGGGILVNDYKIDGNSQSTNCVGLDVRGTSDGVYQNIIMTDVYTGLITDKSNIFDNVHPWIATASLFSGSKAFVIEGGDSLFLHCYPDTYHYNFYISNNAFVNINQCKQYHNYYVANRNTIEAAGGNIYAFYYDTESTSKNTFIHNSTFACQILNNDYLYGNQSNLEKPLYNIDRTTQWKGYKQGQGLKYVKLEFNAASGITIYEEHSNFNNNICWYNIRFLIGQHTANTEIDLGYVDTNFLPPYTITTIAYVGNGPFQIDGYALVRIETNGKVTAKLQTASTQNGCQLILNTSFFATTQI